MAWRRSTVYAVVASDHSVRFHYSPKPAVDVVWWDERGARRIIPLGPPLPPAWAHWVCRDLQRQVDVQAHSSPAGGTMSNGGDRAALTGWRRLWPDRHRKRTLRQMVSRTRRALWIKNYSWAGHVYEPITLTEKVAGSRRGARKPPLFASSSSPSLPFESGLSSWPAVEDLDDVADLLAGRVLTELEVVQLADRAGLQLERPVEQCLVALAVSGRIGRRPGLEWTVFGGWRCLRCGGTEEVVPWDCAACGETYCWMCEECRSMGPVRACTLLYTGATDEDAGGKSHAAATVGTHIAATVGTHAAAMAGTHAGAIVGDRRSGSTNAARTSTPVTYKSHSLTDAQARAARKLQQFVTGEQQEALVWAVCGAGKTEVSFPAVAHVLGNGGRVLFAIPRRDVVEELGQRLRRAFGQVPMQILHGGAGRTELTTLQRGSLTIATTHQVLRFERAFDFVVLDEVDAFPYRGSRMLRGAMAKAVAPGGRIVRMSATPGKRLIKRAEADGGIITIPARHHGHPLPVPRLHRDYTLMTREGPFRPSRLMRALLRQSLQGNPPTRLLIFVPDVDSTERVAGGIERHLVRAGIGSSASVLSSHARDPERAAKVRALQQGRCHIFVATSILERGITVPDVDVIVLFADTERTFSEAALVQMAGRVGRTAARPTGRVHFIGGRINRAMRDAVSQIERLNGEANRLGLLRQSAN